MSEMISIDGPLGWREIVTVAEGGRLVLSEPARQRIVHARRIVEALVERGIRGYGINTGVGALCNVVISRENQQALSCNIILSHACGVGEPLGRIIPLIPSRCSVGYLTHAAAIGLVLIGHGSVASGTKQLDGTEALSRIGLKPLQLEAKEGLSLVNGTPCATGLAALALARTERLFGWADAAAAMTYENLGSQTNAFAEEALALRRSPGLMAVGETLRNWLAESPMLAEAAGTRTQDPLSLRAIPQVHGAARDAFDQVAEIVNRELSSVTDNPAVSGSPGAPEVHSQAHAVGAALGLAMDSLAVAAAEVAAISERRIDRLVNPLVSGLPAFLAGDSGVSSGYMIAQYTAAALAAENRRLAAPASLDGGITSALQEDMLTHATPAAWKVLSILDNLERILAIELLAAAQAYDLQPQKRGKAQRTDALYRRIRTTIPIYGDDRPMNEDFDRMRTVMQCAADTAG
jgi:histidine ammonia-lyase